MKNLVPSVYRVSVKALIIKDSRILLWKSPIWVWWFPGWGNDHGENIFEGLKREINEELNLEVAELSEKPVFISNSCINNKWIPVFVIFYKIGLKSFDFTPSDEISEIWYFSLSEIQGLKMNCPGVKFREFLVSNPFLIK